MSDPYTVKAQKVKARKPEVVSSLILCLLVGFASCQHEQGRGGFQYGNPPPANILLHKQALGQDGSFNYAFAADNGLQQGEVINPDGSRKGSYSYVDPNGKTITLSYTAGKDGFRVLNGDHLPKAPEPQQQRQNPQYYQPQPQQQQRQQYPQSQHLQSSQQDPSRYSLFRPNPVPFEAYRNAPDAPAYRGNPTSHENAYMQVLPHPHHQRQYPSPVPSRYREPEQYEGQYRRPFQNPHHVRPMPQYQPPQYSVQEGNYDRSSPYLAQQFTGDYRQEDPRKPHSFGNGYSFEFAG